MLEWLAALTLFGALILLAVLCVIDLRIRLLPNKYTLPLALLAPCFHLLTQNVYVIWPEMILGGLMGFGSLYLLRVVANYYYKTDTLGLGDVKLIGAGGLWLGGEIIMLAMAAGACAGLLHGLGYALWQKIKTGQTPPLARLQIPAGPGFAIGLVAGGFYQFWGFSPF